MVLRRPQLNLLEDVCSPGVAQVRSGYLTSSDIANPSALATALESRFEEIGIGVHDDVPVVLGYTWDGQRQLLPEASDSRLSSFCSLGLRACYNSSFHELLR
jgi:hypothetical protein